MSNNYNIDTGHKYYKNIPAAFRPRPATQAEQDLYRHIPETLEELEKAWPNPMIRDEYLKSTGESTSAPQRARDVQVGGDHYRKHGDMQPWDIIQEYGGVDDLKVFLRWTAVKYLLRDKANRLEDDKKALHCLTRLVELSE